MVIERRDSLSLSFFEVEYFLLKENLITSAVLVGRWLKCNSNMKLVVTASLGSYARMEITARVINRLG
jgi:hypothetical protein